MLPKQRGQAAAVGLAEQPGPGLIGQDILKHEGVDIDEGGLQYAQAQHGHLDLLAAVGGDLPAAAVADHRVGAVPGLHDVQALLDLPLQAAVAQVAGDEDGLLGPADLQHRLVGRVGGRADEPDNTASVVAVPSLIAVTYLMTWS
jgi:hypothetical protein